MIGFQFAKNLASGTLMSKLLYAAEMCLYYQEIPVTTTRDV